MSLVRARSYLATEIPHAAGAVYLPLVTVPDGRTLIMRSLSAAQDTGDVVPFFVLLTRGSDLAVLDYFEVGPNQSVLRQFWGVAHPGDSVALYADDAGDGNLRALLSGSLLAGAPS